MSFARCVSKEFAAFATRRTAPVSEWLRALARYAHSSLRRARRRRHRHVLHRQLRPRDDGRRVGDRAGAQPAVAAVPASRRPDSARAALGRRPGRGQGSGRRRRLRPRPALHRRRAVPPQRFDTLRRELGDGFIGVEIDSSEGNPWGIPKHGALGAHRRPGRRARPPHPGRARPGAASSSAPAWSSPPPVERGEPPLAAARPQLSGAPTERRSSCGARIGARGSTRWCGSASSSAARSSRSTSCGRPSRTDAGWLRITGCSRRSQTVAVPSAATPHGYGRRHEDEPLDLRCRDRAGRVPRPGGRLQRILRGAATPTARRPRPMPRRSPRRSPDRRSRRRPPPPSPLRRPEARRRTARCRRRPCRSSCRASRAPPGPIRTASIRSPTGTTGTWSAVRPAWPARWAARRAPTSTATVGPATPTPAERLTRTALRRAVDPHRSADQRSGIAHLQVGALDAAVDADVAAGDVGAGLGGEVHGGGGDVVDGPEATERRAVDHRLLDLRHLQHHLERRGGDRTGRDGVDPDLRRQVLGHVPGELDERALGGAVGGEAPVAEACRPPR